jgi:hypothetical protein
MEAAVSYAREARERLGLAAILSVDHAAELIPMDRAAARDWLRACGLIRQVDGKPMVRWGDVYERIGELMEPRPSPVASGLKRARL